MTENVERPLLALCAFLPHDPIPWSSDKVGETAEIHTICQEIDALRPDIPAVTANRKASSADMVLGSIMERGTKTEKEKGSSLLLALNVLGP